MDEALNEFETLFLTGGTGYLGKLLLARLRDEAAAGGRRKTIVLSRDPDRFRAEHPELLFPNLGFVAGEIGTFSLPEEWKIDLVLHGATPADAPSTPEEAEATWKSSYVGTRHLAEVFRDRSLRGCRNPKHLLFLSSGAVYGPQPESVSRLSEEDELPARLTPDFGTPALVYGDAKRAAEALLLGEFTDATGIPVSAARIFAIAGSYIPMAGRFALGQFLRSALETGKITISGDGTAIRSFLEGDELARWLLKLLESPLRHGIYNVGSDSKLTIRQVAETVKEICDGAGIPVTIEVLGNSGVAKGAGHRYIPCIAKAGEALGLRPELDSREAIRKTTRWAIARARG